MREWKILLNGELWSDRFDSEELAEAEIDYYVEQGYGEKDDYTVEEMTSQEIRAYD